jgi:hypothetical protein
VCKNCEKTCFDVCDFPRRFGETKFGVLLMIEKQAASGALSFGAVAKSAASANILGIETC